MECIYIASRLTAEQVQFLDGLIEKGIAKNRSDAIRRIVQTAIETETAKGPIEKLPDVRIRARGNCAKVSGKKEDRKTSEEDLKGRSPAKVSERPPAVGDPLTPSAGAGIIEPKKERDPEEAGPIEIKEEAPEHIDPLKPLDFSDRKKPIFPGSMDEYEKSHLKDQFQPPTV